MPQLNKTVKKKLEALPAPLDNICEDLLIFADGMPEVAVKEHLESLVRKAVKKMEKDS